MGKTIILFCLASILFVACERKDDEIFLQESKEFISVEISLEDQFVNDSSYLFEISNTSSKIFQNNCLFDLVLTNKLNNKFYTVAENSFNVTVPDDPSLIMFYIDQGETYSQKVYLEDYLWNDQFSGEISFDDIEKGDYEFKATLIIVDSNALVKIIDSNILTVSID